MRYFSTEEIAKKWHITSHRIAILAREGRIDGAMLVGKRWMIPESANKPMDGRYKQEKINRKVSFRFPMLVNLKEDDYDPSLSDEEKMLRQAELDFNACRFKDANKLFLSLTKSTNIYIRITATIHLCLISVVFNEFEKYTAYQRTFNMLMANNLAYHNEIMLMKYVFDVIMGIPKELIQDFYVDANYAYHPSALDMLIALSIFTIANGDISSISKLRLDPFEALCQKFMDERKFYEAQLLHLQLTYSYHMKADKQKAIHHMRKMIEIAKDHNLIYLLSVNVTYLPDIFQSVKDEFAADLINKIIHNSDISHQGYVGLTKKLGKHTFYASLSSKEYKYVYLATQGYTNKEIANAMNTTEFYVSKRLGEIYRKLGIKGKHELLDLFTSTAI